MIADVGWKFLVVVLMKVDGRQMRDESGTVDVIRRAANMVDEVPNELD